jgi:L-iditol 2-dehydrogenase
MKAAVVVEEKKIQVKDIPTPEPGPEEVLIKVTLAGLCGSDNALFHGKLIAPFPVVGGHEAIGIIKKLGPGVDELTVGDRVTVHPNYYCGECPLCISGHQNICPHKIRLGIDSDGVFAEFVIVNQRAVYSLPTQLSDEKAVFTEPLAVAVHALNIEAPKTGDRVLVFGSGVIGLLVLQMALLHDIVATSCDLEEKRLTLANKLGASNTIGPNDNLKSFRDSFDVVYETSGAPSALTQSIDLVAPGGSIVVLGLPKDDYPLPTSSIVRKELKIKGSMIYTNEFPRAIELLSENSIQTEPLATDRISLDQIASALNNFSSPDRVKTLVDIT